MGNSFASPEACESALQKVAKKNGFLIRIEHSDQKKKRYMYVCTAFGDPVVKKVFIMVF